MLSVPFITIAGSGELAKMAPLLSVIVLEGVSHRIGFVVDRAIGKRERGVALDGPTPAVEVEPVGVDREVPRDGIGDARIKRAGAVDRAVGVGRRTA